NPPFTTSTLQQSAANRLGFTPSRTMRVAQDLYERGLITYMRTDSVNLSQPAVVQVRKFVKDKFGQNYLPANPRKYKAKSRLVQEAHEAIRPTNIELTAEKLAAASSDQKKLYDLIWRRMVVCQMAEAVVSERLIDVLTKDGKSYLLRATGQKIKFDGWYKIYEKAPIKEQELPELAKDDPLTLIRIDSQQKFTEPPPRFTEATLIRELEKNDIGRPSTYAPTISTLYERAYIEKVEGKKIAPTPIGKTTVDFLVKNFGEIVDVSFTAEMENNLDLIAQGEADLVGTMEKFWGPFDAQVQKVAEEAEKMKVQVEETDEKCEVCGKPMVIRYGRYGKFLACSGFPECKNTKALVFETGLTCPQDGGNIVVKRTKKGKTFWGCANWPKCKFASWQKPPSAASEGEPSQVTA
ncbi:type I DNA topoisomerase, partial [Candidatus Curtissbacteria bacterium]|nr:type I DNA topoisomerase [Candidatus Curtissbacteria bacterium]